MFSVVTVVVYSMFVYTEEMTEHVCGTFITCASDVLPVLFPFMVVSALIIKMHLLSPAERLFSRPFRKFFNLPSASVTPFFLGFLCSFPVGVTSTVESYKNGLLTKNEAEETMALSNNTGPGFVVLLTGITLAHNIGTGILIYIAEIVSSFMTGAIIIRKNDIRHGRFETAPKRKRTNVGQAIAESISGAAVSCGTVVSNVVFFSLISKAVSQTFFVTEKKFVTLMSVFLEFSEGVEAAIALGGPAGVALAAFAVCSGSLSVLCQSTAIASATGLSVKRTVYYKFVQGTIGAVICFFVCLIFPVFLPKVPKNTFFANTFAKANANAANTAIYATIAAGCMIYALIHIIKQRKNILELNR